MRDPSGQMATRGYFGELVTEKRLRTHTHKKVNLDNLMHARRPVLVIVPHLYAYFRGASTARCQ